MSSLFVNQATPTITWPIPAPITFGVPVSNTQLNAGANVPGSFSYNPVAGAILTAGTQTLSATFIPADTIDYVTVAASVNLVVNKATPAITWPVPSPITFGVALSNAQLNAGANVPGYFTYNKTVGTILTAGTQPLSVTFIPADTIDFAIVTAGVNLVVNKATPAITWPVPAPITYGAALSNAQLNATANVPGSFTYNKPAGTILTAGTQPLSATFTPVDTIDFATVISSVNLVVNKATPALSWSVPAPITYGAALSNKQLNAGDKCPRKFHLQSRRGHNSHGGHAALVGDLHADRRHRLRHRHCQRKPCGQPGRADAFVARSGSDHLRRCPGQCAVERRANIAGTYSYSIPAGTALQVGTHSLSVTFTPTDATDYATASASVNLIVTGITPVLTWPVPAPITYGVALGNTQLDASANTAGTYSYNIPEGTALQVGTHLLSVTFTPTDAIDYATVSASVNLVVTPATPVLTWPVPAPIAFGVALSNVHAQCHGKYLGNFQL